MQGNEVKGILITWDLSEFDISKVGTYTIFGTINGYEERVPLTIHVTENIVLGYKELADVYTVLGVNRNYRKQSLII